MYICRAQAAFLERQRQQQEREQRENRKMVYDPKTNSFVAVKVKGKNGKMNKRQKCVYISMLLDTGAKAGSSKTRRSDGDSSSSSSTSSSDTDSDSDMSNSDLSDMEDMETKQEDEEDMNEDEDIPLPEGPPPTDSKAADQSKEEDDDEDDDDIPLPEGPPPPKPFQTQLAPIQAAQMRPPPPPPPRPPHFTPQFHGMPMAGSYGMMVPPPPPPGRPPAHAMRVPPPPPPSSKLIYMFVYGLKCIDVNVYSFQDHHLHNVLQCTHNQLISINLPQQQQQQLKRVLCLNQVKWKFPSLHVNKSLLQQSLLNPSYVIYKKNFLVLSLLL